MAGRLLLVRSIATTRLCDAFRPAAFRCNDRNENPVPASATPASRRAVALRALLGIGRFVRRSIEQTGQTSMPSAAPPATRTETTGSVNQDPTTKQMNDDAKKKLETEGK
jgi:hypothetical protein